MANKDFYLNNFRYVVTNSIRNILMGFDTVGECREFIADLYKQDAEAYGAENADPAFYHIFFNKKIGLGKEVK